VVALVQFHGDVIGVAGEVLVGRQSDAIGGGDITGLVAAVVTGRNAHALKEATGHNISRRHVLGRPVDELRARDPITLLDAIDGVGLVDDHPLGFGLLLLFGFGIAVLRGPFRVSAADALAIAVAGIALCGGAVDLGMRRLFAVVGRRPGLGPLLVVDRHFDHHGAQDVDTVVALFFAQLAADFLGLALGDETQIRKAAVEGAGLEDELIHAAVVTAGRRALGDQSGHRLAADRPSALPLAG